ncbi:MAG TPA: helicase-related protein, partial [Opitutales bacterium]|nr:helicase-related protein [Opitutales bacterium]
EVRPTDGQVEDLIGEINQAAEAGQRVLVTTLTKRMSEDISAFLREAGIRVEYLHSDIDAIERVEILRKLRAGDFDVLVGVNLLREGLDLPEVALVAILDADKEGFLRNTTSLIQTSGRAARHEKGRVILYAEKLTDSLRATLEITRMRREKQMAFNELHGITPTGVRRGDQTSLQRPPDEDEVGLVVAELGGSDDVAKVIAELENEMVEASRALEFERAAILRDQILALKSGKGITVVGKERKGSPYRRKRR